MQKSTVVALIRGLPPLLLLTTATACGGQVSVRSSFPPRADLEAVTETKPAPTIAIVESAQAAEHYNAAVEAWGDRVAAAGARLCKFYQTIGMTVRCPPPP